MLAESRVSVLRIEYREPNVFDECVVDVLAGCSFLRGIGATDIALAGHSFGGAVVVKAGELWPPAVAVVGQLPPVLGEGLLEVGGDRPGGVGRQVAHR